MFVSVRREKMPFLVFGVVQFDVIDTCRRKKLIPLVHLDAERIQHILCLFRLLYDGILSFIFLADCHRKDSKIMFQERVICSELHHLRVNEDKLQF